jgi:hypothetical protein
MAIPLDRQQCALDIEDPRMAKVGVEPVRRK